MHLGAFECIAILCEWQVDFVQGLCVCFEQHMSAGTSVYPGNNV